MNDLLACPNSSTTLRVHLFTSCNLADVFTDQAAETSATPHGAVVAQARLPRARVRPARDHGGAGSRCNGQSRASTCGFCEVSVPVSRNGSGTYATSWALLLGLPPGLARAPNSFSLS